MKNKPLKKVMLAFCLGLCASLSFSQIPTRIIVNSGFELPVMGCSPASLSFFPHGLVPGWRTLDSVPAATMNCGTGSTNAPYLIEFWSSGFLGRNSHSGNQLAEINASQPTFLYQEICVLANEVVPFSVWHLRRAASGSGEQMVAELKTSNNVNIVTAATHTATGSWTNYTGNLTNNGSTGIRRYGFRAISGGSGGNLIDDVTISLPPLVDIRDFQFSTNFEADTNFLRIYVNGTLNSAATVNITKSGTATYLTDYTIGSVSRGSTSINSNGDIVLTLPAGDYNPNLSAGTTRGMITIAFIAINEGVVESNESLSYAITGSANGGGGNSALDLATSINGQSAACAAVVSSTTFTILDAIALPVVLLSFTVEREVGYNHINWEVTEENNIHKYLLEYSVDGNDFKVVDEILFNPSNDYRYQSIHRSMKDKSAYYRISVVDNEGYNSVLSNVIMLSKESDKHIFNHNFSIYPNPCNGIFTANFYSAEETVIDIGIFDVYGKKVHSIGINAVKGENSIPINLGEEFSSGIYSISYSNGTNTTTQKLNIVK